MIPLTMAPTGEELSVVKINGKDEVRQHLNELGFVPEAPVIVINEIGGNMIISLKSSRVALDKAMAGRIMVDGSDFSHVHGPDDAHHEKAPGHWHHKRGHHK